VTTTTTQAPTPARTTTPVVFDEALRAALSAHARPPRPSAVSASVTFGWRALLKIKHVPEQLFDVTVFPIMFTLLFTYLFGGALAGSTGEYLQFLLPGILVQTVVLISMYTGMALNTDVSKGVFDRFRSLPIWTPSALVGALLGDVARFSAASTLVVALGLALGYRPGGGVVGVVLAVAVVLAFSFSIGWLWNLFGMIMRTPNAVMGASMMIMFPLTFASNIFVDPTTMPGWLQAFVGVNPVSHVSTAARGLMGGNVRLGDLGWVAVWCAALTGIFAPLTMWRYQQRS
jgi:ABC-2 type transport system permease protein